MLFALEFITILIYCLCLFMIFIFSMGQLHLTWHYLQYKKQRRNHQDLGKENLPNVTVQLPIYNERYVVKRLIKAVIDLDYPKDKLEIQVLDDSNDDTVDLVDELVDNYGKDHNIKAIRREDRVGFKAGALQYGLRLAKGEFLAIFDADFIPEPDFLLKSLGAFADKSIGMVQTRWGHVNKDYSVLTKLQAFGLDAHFSIEQVGRSQAGSFINFNGTAGIWRKACIIDAGGWSADTLTEDLDLSYRAQINGWKFQYLENVVAPAELPVLMSAVKSQQFRWNKGAAETARKNLRKVLRLNISWINKFHAVLHLFNSSVFIFLLIAGILSIPMLYIKDAHPNLEMLFNLGSVFLFGFLSIAFFYWIANREIQPQGHKKYYLTMFPTFLTVIMGLSLHNALAVLEGLLGFKSPFIRTPKFNVFKSKDSWKGNVYISSKLNLLTITEGILALYFVFGIALGIYLEDWGLLFFHAMLAIGFAVVFFLSVKPLKYATES